MATQKSKMINGKTELPLPSCATMKKVDALSIKEESAPKPKTSNTLGTSGKVPTGSNMSFGKDLTHKPAKFISQSEMNKSQRR